jgi:hypothetical protein
MVLITSKSRDSSVGIATDWSAWLRFPSVQYLFLHSVNTESGVHPDSYPMDKGGAFFWRKEAGAWNWPLTAI